MKETLVRILVCPDCREKLQLVDVHVKRLNINEHDFEEIWKGALICSKCKRIFPIIDGIPWLYPKELKRGDIEKEFLKEINKGIQNKKDKK